MHCGSKSCMSLMGWVVLLVGVLFLLRDLNIWNFWNIHWWTAVFLLMGLGKVHFGYCKQCQKACKHK